MAGTTRPKRRAMQNWLLVWWEKGISFGLPFSINFWVSPKECWTCGRLHAKRLRLHMEDCATQSFTTCRSSGVVLLLRLMIDKLWNFEHSSSRPGDWVPSDIWVTDHWRLHSCNYAQGRTPLEAILVIFGRRALILFCLKALGKNEKWHHFCAHAQWDHLGDAKMSKKGTSLRRI